MEDAQQSGKTPGLVSEGFPIVIIGTILAYFFSFLYEAGFALH